MKKLPDNFFEWLFKLNADSQNFSTRYGKADAAAEYGISVDDYLNENRADAIQDARDVFSAATIAAKTQLVGEWKTFCTNEANRLYELAVEKYETEN